MAVLPCVSTVSNLKFSINIILSHLYLNPIKAEGGF